MHRTSILNFCLFGSAAALAHQNFGVFRRDLLVLSERNSKGTIECPVDRPNVCHDSGDVVACGMVCCDDGLSCNTGETCIPGGCCPYEVSTSRCTAPATCLNHSDAKCPGDTDCCSSETPYCIIDKNIAFCAITEVQTSGHMVPTATYAAAQTTIVQGPDSTVHTITYPVPVVEYSTTESVPTSTTPTESTPAAVVEEPASTTTEAAAADSSVPETSSETSAEASVAPSASPVASGTTGNGTVTSPPLSTFTGGAAGSVLSRGLLGVVGAAGVFAFL